MADLTDIQLNWAGTFTGVPLTPTNGSPGPDSDKSTTAANGAAGGGVAPAGTSAVSPGPDPSSTDQPAGAGDQATPATPAASGGDQPAPTGDQPATTGDQAVAAGDQTAPANPAAATANPAAATGDQAALASNQGAPDGGQAAPGGAPAGNDAPLKATDTDIFFGKDSADLTPDDKTSLDAYAKAYTDAQSTSDITLDGYASIEGDAGHNKDLSQNRVQAVADYLVSKGVGQDKIKPSPPHGGSKKWGGDLASNRRVTLAPKPPAAPATVSPDATLTNSPALDPSSPDYQKGLQKTLDDSKEVGDWLHKHLKDNDLRPDPLSDKGDRAMYKNKSTAVDDIVNETLQAGKNAGLKDPNLLTEDRVRKAVTDALMESIPKVPGAKDPAKATFTLNYQFVPFTDHKGLSDGKNTTDQPGHQIQVQITAKFHGEDESGAEIQGQLTGTLFADGANQQIQWQQVQGGAQVSWVQNFFNNNLSVSPQLAVSFGGARAPMGQPQTMQWTPTGQVTAGGQVTFKVPGFKGQLQVGLQGQVGVTDPSGSQSTLDKTWVFTLTYTF